MVEKGSKNQISSYTVIWKSGRIETATSEKMFGLLFINFLRQIQLYAEGYHWKSKRVLDWQFQKYFYKSESY